MVNLNPSSENLLLGSSDALQEALRVGRRVAGSEAAVLILGESGTGKELMAHAVHDWSVRRSGPFVALNCASFSRELLESELFGHERGAFTGAVARKVGRCELAAGGTMFLDEVAELPIEVQGKLLRFLQDHEFTRLGGTETLHADVRIVSATNQNLKKQVRTGEFRQDLFFRLNVVEINLPPLRNRQADLEILVQHFVRRYATEAGWSEVKVSTRFFEALKKYPWPGNIRELQNAIQRAVVLSDGEELRIEDLPPEVRQTVRPDLSGLINLDQSINFNEVVWQFKRNLLLQAMQQTDGNQSQAARLLGLQQANLNRMLKRYDIPKIETITWDELDLQSQDDQDGAVPSSSE